MKKQASFLILGVILCLGLCSLWINFIEEPAKNSNLSSPVEVAAVSSDNLIGQMYSKSGSLDSVASSHKKNPEPATLVLVGVGLVGFVSMRLSRERES